MSAARHLFPLLRPSRGLKALSSQNLLPCTKLERLIKLNVRNVLENEIERVRLDLHLTPQDMDWWKMTRNDGMVTLCYWARDLVYDRDTD